MEARHQWCHCLEEGQACVGVCGYHSQGYRRCRNSWSEYRKTPEFLLFLLLDYDEFRISCAHLQNFILSRQANQKEHLILEATSRERHKPI